MARRPTPLDTANPVKFRKQLKIVQSTRLAQRTQVGGAWLEEERNSRDWPAPAGNAEWTYVGKRAPKDVMDALPESPAGKGRHHCAVCAYHAGFELARARALGKQLGDDARKKISATLDDLNKKPD